MVFLFTVYVLIKTKSEFSDEQANKIGTLHKCLDKQIVFNVTMNLVIVYLFVFVSFSLDHCPLIIFRLSMIHTDLSSTIST